MVQTIKEILLYAVIFLPFALLYNILEIYFGDSWWPAIIVITLMLIARVSLYLYRRHKGIRDTWLDP
ncbi:MULTISPECIES: hypothetical protein [Pseudomonas]|uniref:hypothetical protein n=1 Tax=Pseudomonas TaxID=286 RepID=UPI002160AAED|nr:MULTISPECIES: hypothetical protein [unclassified Pseudomonas]UVM48726.1 hypothetical protein LOY38_20430 [Pseudomonas sp. B21-015]WPN58700.1 hypothetical protein QMK51_03450 [Pseudomonas sp. P9_31]